MTWINAQTYCWPASTAGRQRPGINVGKGCFRGIWMNITCFRSGCYNGVTLELKKKRNFFFFTHITTGFPLLAKETSVSMCRKRLGALNYSVVIHA